MNQSARRPYRQGARADAAVQTGERILDAATAAFWESPTAEVSLEEVARRAGVAPRTVIRRFGGAAGVMAAAVERESQRVAAERAVQTPGDVPAAIASLVGHYERLGDAVVRLVAASLREPELRPVVDAGREVHRTWCREAFAPQLAGMPRTVARRRLATLVAVCDAQTWWLLRRHGGLSRPQTELALVELVVPVLEVP